MEAREVINDTKIEQLINNLRKTSLFKQVVPMEAAAGWPVPVVENNEAYVLVPFYGSSVQGKGRTVIYPPVCYITVKWSNKTIVEYVNLRYRNNLPEGKWNSPAGQFPHEAVSKMTVREYKEKKQQLMEAYDRLFDGIDSKAASLDDKGFKELITVLMEPALLPFYRSFNPVFFKRYFG